MSLQSVPTSVGKLLPVASQALEAFGRVQVRTAGLEIGPTGGPEPRPSTLPALFLHPDQLLALLGGEQPSDLKPRRGPVAMVLSLEVRQLVELGHDGLPIGKGIFEQLLK